MLSRGKSLKGPGARTSWRQGAVFELAAVAPFPGHSLLSRTMRTASACTRCVDVGVGSGLDDLMTPSTCFVLCAARPPLVMRCDLLTAVAVRGARSLQG